MTTTVTKPDTAVIDSIKGTVAARAREWANDNGYAQQTEDALRALFGTAPATTDGDLEPARAWIEDTLVRWARANGYCDVADRGIAAILGDDDDDEERVYYDSDNVSCDGQPGPARPLTTPAEFVAALLGKDRAFQEQVYTGVMNGRNGR